MSKDNNNRKSKNNDFKLENDEEVLTLKENEILEKNNRFFSSDKKYIHEMLNIIDHKSNISLRVLDWFVANYSKKKGTMYKIKINGSEILFKVNSEYKNQLNAYSKRYFDPFCRKKKVEYNYKSLDRTENILFISSIGQLNFFQWAMRNKVIKYVQLHLKEIDADMKETYKMNKLAKSAKKTINSDDNEEDIDNTSINYNSEPDPEVCSSVERKLVISPKKSKSVSIKKKNNKNKLSKISHDSGIRKTMVPIEINFD